MLSVLVERASGQKLSVFAEERIFAPLGMDVTVFFDDVTLVVPNRATGYGLQEDRSRGVSETMFPAVGDGGLMTTVEDLAKWDASAWANRIDGHEGIWDRLLAQQTVGGSELVEVSEEILNR